MSSKRKFNRKSKYTLSQKIISAVTAAGFIMQPVVGFANSIIKADSALQNSTVINKGNGVTDIWADKVVGNAAVNVFDQFKLNPNNIANMYFNTIDKQQADAANLVNFVNSRIDINGTVNAVKDNKIGGNLFFLSKDGMAVGKSGVINTGSLYVMTPTQKYMEDMMDVVGNPTDTGADAVLANVVDTAKWHEIPVNASGTITVLGQVNATNEVQMRAAKIGVGKNVSGTDLNDGENGAVGTKVNEIVKTAAIKTGITNFADVVKLTKEQREVAGITQLTATMEAGSGDIVLSAYVDNKSDVNPVENIPVVGSSVINDLVSWGENTFKEQTFDASVDVYGTVDAKGKADITAKAVNSNAELNEQGNYVSNGNNDVAQLANVNANVNIGNGGKVTAEKDVNVKAEALNRYIDNTGAIADVVMTGVSSSTPLTGNAAYSKLDTDASVNIEKGAKVESTGGDVNINAKAETMAASAASTLGLKFKTLGGYTGANVPAGSVVYTEADNDANVTVNGDVTAAENINIDADADLTVEAENKITVTGEKANQFVLGVTIAKAENKADITIGVEENKDNSGNVTTASVGNLVTATGDLDVNATANSNFTSKTSVSAGESSAVGIAVNVTEFDSGANVNVNTDLTAGKDLIVNAADTVAADNVIAETKVGSGKYMSSATQIAQQNGSIDAVKGFFGKVAEGLGFGGGGDDIKNKLSIGEVFKAGATVTYSGQNHNSSVTIGNDAKLNAGGKLDVDAATKIEDAHFAATGATYSYNDATSAPIDLNAAVLVTNMNNSSSVVVEDAATENGAEHKAELSGAEGVNINASTRFEYNRVQKMKDAVTDAAAQIEHAFTTLDTAFKEDFGKIPDGFEDLKEKYTAAYEAFTGKMNGIEDGTQVTSGADNFIDAIVAGYEVLTALENLNTMLDKSGGSQVMQNASEAFKGASDLFSGALAFIDPNSYGTFAAASQSKGSSGDVGGSAPGGGSVTGAVGGQNAAAVNGAGAVMVNDVNSVSKVEIGKDTVITSNRDVNLGAENYMKDLSLGGLNLGLFSNAGGGTAASIGATVNYAEFDTDTIVTVNDGASITGGNIDIDAQNTIDHISVAASAGKGPSSQTGSSGVVLNGMLSFVNGSSDILTVVDDGAKLTANQNDYTETNDKDETIKGKTEGNIIINGHNNTNITNVAAGASWGHGSAAVGVGLAYTDFEVKNITGVADVAGQVKALYATNSDGSVDNEELEEAQNKFANTYEEETAGKEDGGISAYDFSLDAATDGSIQSVSAAGTLSNNDDTGQIGFFDKIGSGLNTIDQKLVGTNGLVDKASSALTGSGKNGANVDDVLNTGTQTHGGNGGLSVSGEVNTYMPSFSLAGSGSVSVNMLDNATQAIVDNAKITINQAQGKEKGDITVTARDALYAGAYSGAAALQWNSGGSSTDTTVGVSGAAGVNDIANTVKATIKNSTLSGAGKVDTMALSGGQQLALGLGLAIVKADGTKGYSGNAAVSVNLIDHDVEALQENNTVTNTNDVNVYAYARDLENTGGGTFSGGQQQVGGGATVGVAQLNNNITAGIKGGTYTDVESVDVMALNALQSVTVGAAAGITVNEEATANVQGAGVYNSVHNTTNAFISGTDDDHKAVITTKDGGTVNVTAQDTAENADLELRLAGLADGRETLIKVFGPALSFLTGENYFEGIDTTAAGEEINLNKNTGSSIVTVGASVSGTNGKAAVGGAAAITDIENNYTANIDYADITTETLTADAGSDSNIVTVAGGVAVAGKGSGVGSVSWNDVDNTAKVNIQNSTIKAQNTTATAENTAQIVSVTGQISGGGKAAVGAALGYVGLDNSTEANIINTSFDKRYASETEGTKVKAEAQNSSDSYNIGAGVSAAGEAAVSGTVVVTQTQGTAGAVMDGAKINNAKEIIAHASDDTDILSVIGTVNIAGTAAVGAGVAYTEIGGVSADKEKAEQYVTAEIKNSTINTASEDSKIEVKAEDNSKVTNIAIGVGGALRAAVQGASATTLINKETSAEITNTKIDAEKEVGKNANVTVDAQNASEITSSASTAVVAGQGAGVGAGIAVNRIIQQTNAEANGGVMNVNNLKVNANGTPRIENVGVGVAVAGQGAGVTGSVAVNMIENDVTAHIGNGAKIVADGSIGIIATSDEQIANYAGQAGVAGMGAGAGVSVAVNEIAGTTSATVGGEEEAETSVTAKGKDSIKTNTLINVEDEINDTLIDGDTVGMDAVIGRQEEERSGLIVDASSTRDLKSFIITAGVGGTGAGIAGTVNVNQINGETKAGITNTVVNGGSANTANAGNVTVNAGDYSNMSGFVGSVGVGGIGAGAGLASDTNTISRDVTAKVDSSDIKAQGFELDADSAQGVSSFGTGVGAAGVGGGAAGVVTVTELNNTTKAMLNNSKVNANTVNVAANHIGIVNAGNVSVGGAGLGVGGGLSVGVLKDNSITETTVKGDKAEEDTITASGDVIIAANNNATVNPMISANGVGAFGGVAGATSINNLNSTVKTNIEGVGITSTGGSISGTADNTFNVKAYMGTIGAGGVGVGAGVTVNTIDSTVQTNVNGSTLDAANDIILTAKETRNIEQLATNVAAGGIAVGANIAVTNVGQAVENVVDEDGETISDAKDKIDEANKVFINEKTGEDNSKDLLAGAGDALITSGIAKDENDVNNFAPTVDAGYGGVTDDNGNKVSQITVNIKNSNIDAGNNVTAKATETDNITMTLGGGSAGAVAVSAGVGILNVHRNVGVDINGGNITAGSAVNVGTDINGESRLEAYQGSVGVVGANVVYAGINTTGNSAIDLNGVTLAGKNISIAAQDNAKTSLQAIGVAAGAGALSALAAEAANDSDVSVNMTGTTVTATGEETKDDDGNTVIDGGNVTVTTNKANTVTAQAVNTAGGAVGGAGMGATVTDTGSSSIGLTGNTMQAANTINVNAKTNSTLKADIVSAGAGWFAAGAVSIAKVSAGTAKDHLKTAVTIDGGNTFAAQNTNFAANSNISESMDMDALAISGYASIGGNSTTSDAYADATVTAEADNTYKGAADNAGNVSFNADNTVTQSADTSGISAAGMFATGTNIGETTSNLKTEVNVKGSTEASKVNNFNANASSYASIDNKVNGDGGAIADISPYAAKVNNNYTADTDVTIGGTWNTAGSFTAQAVNGMDIDIKSDAVRAAVIGGSGTWLDNTINNAANVTVVDGATITTGGAQNYTAQNTVDYVGEIDGSGYGGINVNATDYSDELDFTAGVDITGSTLHGTGDSGSITAFANTQGDITTKNSLKSAGVIPISLAFSDHAIDYNNSVNVVDSDLTTDKADADITLAATDDTDVKLETIADTQGGVAGAASAEASNKFNRANKINIDKDSDLLSTKDINLYAGADANGSKSSLNLQVLADAYNKTAIPVYTDPTVNNTMTQKNQIELAGNAESVRHINASAQKGTTTVTESAQEYKVWTGTGGEGQVASTALGGQIKSETADNYINVTGTAKAGIHNELDITIGGHTTVQDPVYNADETEIVDAGGISYDDVTITVNKGSDWFNANTIEPSNIKIVNGLMERYNQVMEYLAAYAEGSDAYNAYLAEKNLLLTEMLKAGLAERDGNDNIVPLDYIDVPAISLPDIVVSGGNINIEADTLKGNGEINAQGAPQITVTNKSDLYLKVQDVTISDNGGHIYVNANDSFTGNKHEDGTSTNTPTITIHGASDDSSQFVQYGNERPQADIGIFGDITNIAGDVKIINDNYNILVDGNVSGRNIQISATKGNVTQQSSSGVLNVGNDPITKLQFSEAVAEKIQKYLHSLKQNGSLEFKDYKAYLNWLVNTVGITLGEIGYVGDFNKLTETDGSLYLKVKIYEKKLLMSNEEAQQILDSKKAAGFDTYQSYLNAIGAEYTYDVSGLEAAATDESAGILAGGNIYIDAVNVNIGGLIQSGYGNYSTKLTAEDNKRVNDLDKEWQANKVALTDADIIGNSKYLVNGGGEVYNTSTKVWDYEVKVYYNPSTGQLLTESVRPEGGNIQISGKVSSTGGGRIMAMDGTSDVSIDTTAVNKDVKVNSITVNDITGLISITDKNVVTKNSNDENVNGLVTEYKNGQWRQYAYGDDATNVKWNTGNLTTYDPVSDTQFAWTGGASGEVIRQKHYTEDFLFWGALSYNTSEALLDHLEQIGVDVEGTIISTGSSEDPTPMKDGSLITDGYKGGDNMFRIDWTYSNPGDVTEATDPTVKKEYDGTAGKIFGYGEYTYTWTETTGDQMASTTGIKADNTIQIGFLGNGDGDGNITVNSGKDMLLNGNISNATVVNENNDFVGKGVVNLNSSGAIEAIGSANINSDDVNIKAATGVNVNHSAIGDSANINIATNSGDIKFVSTGGDLNIEQAVTGGANAIDVATGSVYLEAQGDILDAATGDYAVKGQRIDLISNTGNIGSLNDNGTVTNAFRVIGGSELYSSDTMASSVNAQAQGDIVLTQVDNDNAANGSSNMRLGTIVSENGDAVLTVNDGSFVDAHSSENNDSSSAQDKIDRWLEAGLISDQDEADSSANAAKEAKEERMDALNSQADSLAYDAIYDSTIKPAVDKYQEAADAFAKDETIIAAQQTLQDALLEAGDNEEQIAAANAAYQQVVDSYFAGKDYNETEQKFIANNDTAAATKYVFDNSKADTVQSYKDAAGTLANAFANNPELQEAKDTYINTYKTLSAEHAAAIEAANGDAGKIEELNKDYQAKYDKITGDYLAAQSKVYGGNFTEAEQQLINSYAEVDVEESNYGWSKNQLLYAIQESVLNSEAGEDVQIVNTPNVTANNITLNAANGGVGIDGEAIFISNNELNNEDNLKLLAAAKVGDLTWGKNEQDVAGVTVQQQQAITVSVNKKADGTYGNVDVTGKDNVYLAGVSGSQLNITGVDTDGNIRLQGDAGINVNGMLSGKDLILTGKEGNIAGNDNGYVKMDVTGNVYANITGDINIHHTGNMNLLSIVTNQSANLKADGSILMYTDSNTEAQGRITADIVNLTAGSSIGTADNAIRVLDNGVVINASANGDIILAGAHGDDSTGSIVLGDIEGANLDVTSISNINLGRTDNTATEDDETVNSDIKAGVVELTTSSGSITETEGSVVNANTVKATATQNVLLRSNDNQINNFVVNGYGENGNSLAGNVDLVSKANNANNIVNVEFGKDVGSSTVGLTVNNGYVKVNSLGVTSNLDISGGSVTTTGEGNNVTFTSEGSITADTTVNSAADIVMNADGAINNTGNLTAQDNVNVKTTVGDVNLGGTIMATDNDVAITSGSGAITTTGAIKAGNNVNVDTENGAISIGGDVTGQSGVTVNSTVGEIEVNGAVNAVKSDVAITTGSGDITTTGAVTGGTNVTINAGTTGNIDLGGIVNAQAGNVDVIANEGYIHTTGDVTANNNVNVDTATGYINLEGKVNAATGSVDVDTQSGNVTTKGEVTGYTDVDINSDDGDVTIGGKVQSETGSTHINAGTEEDPGITEDKDGNVTVNSEVASGKEVIVNANNGSITVTGNTTASDGNVQTIVKGDGNINLNGSVSASGDVKAEVEGVGDIITGENATVSGTNIGFTTNEGDIATGSDLTAKEDVDLNVNTGDITFGGNVTASDGNITIDITGDGNLQDAENKDNTLTAISVDGSEDAGNIIIRLGGKGDVDLYDLYATNAARIDIADGSLTLHEINGELVAMQLRTEGKNMNVENIVAGTQIVLTGSDMTLDQIAQRPDADGMLVITPDNAEADKPIDNFTIGDIKTNSDSGIRFDRLWVNNSDIHISEGQLWFDKLYVEDNAHFSNDEMTAAIYGKPPLRDGSDSVYWINTEENRPESSLDMWLNGTGDWMYLRFTDDHIQESNGILLTLDEYDYVYDQRFTAENHLRWQHGRYLDEDWKQAYGYGLSLHNRYGLIDYQEFTETNAGADEVAVEA